ncbi:MAG: hypothetical protein J2P25_24115, partial [Nocardiopsaceae bacterium]|nr:hypothetical protein [Nocardiopsaceae bacterium]
MEYARGHADATPARQGSGTFTGRVFVAPVLASDDGGRQVRVNSVMFEPGARTFWHSHADGQLLMPVGGRGVG